MGDERRLSERVIGCAHTVCRELGAGFLEVVYEKALALELEEKGVSFEVQRQLDVYYKGRIVGCYAADLVIENKLIVELKAVSALNDRHKAQVLNYLRATGLHVGLLLNFGMPRLGIQRIVWKYNESNNV